MAEIVTLTGSSLQSDPDEVIVSMLRRLLSEAEHGRIRGIAYVSLGSDGSYSTAWEGPSDTRHRMSSGIMVLQARWTQDELIIHRCNHG